MGSQRVGPFLATEQQNNWKYISNAVLCLVTLLGPPLCDPMDCTLPGPWGFSRQEYWSGLPSPPPGDLPNWGIEPRSPALQADSLPAEPPGKPRNTGVGSLSLLQGIFPTIELRSPALQADSLPAELPGKPILVITDVKLFLYFRLHKVICTYYLMDAHVYGINEMLLMVP